MNNKFWIFLVILIAVGVGVLTWLRYGDNQAPAPLNTTGVVTLALGETANVFDLEITFNRIVEESRCPIDAICIQAGRFVGEFTLTTDETATLTRELAYTGASSTESVIGNYRLAIQNLKPQSILASEPPSPSDYEVELIVRRQ